MDTNIYSEILEQLQVSTKQIHHDALDISTEIDEDINEIIKVVDINSWEANIDGEIKNIQQILLELKTANHCSDKSNIISSIAMLRCAICDIENAFSNTMDSMESLIVSIRDKP